MEAAFAATVILVILGYTLHLVFGEGSKLWDTNRREGQR